ncbi:MAG: RNA polymerase sigma factor [Planctomycetales bacterium]|jgi:RNA polymerase sigma factor (sigma-70 family)
MSHSAVTRPSLLVRIRDRADNDAWARFVEIYGPLIYGFVRKRGLQDADAVDLVQDVLRSVAGAISRLEYDPARGKFRAWLFTIVKNRLRNTLKVQARRESGSGDSAVAEQIANEPAPDDWQVQWEADHQRRLFDWASEQVQTEVENRTWQAFRKTAVDGASGKEVARELNMSVAVVYLAKSRVMARLKELVREAEATDEHV